IKLLLASPVMHVDETSLKLDKKNHWVHVCSAGDITLKRLHAKRGAEAMNEINIIPRYGGVIIHDCWASYFSYRTPGIRGEQDARTGSRVCLEC
ncbi:MAG: transposase, partial [Rhodothermales bacterium]|nr:transposase [Rhodothermales bacterium]